MPTIISARPSRLSDEREHEVYGVVLELLAETGYEALTMDAIAHRAHTSKATIYRQWGGKPRLVAAAIHATKAHQEIPDTGCLRGDLVALARAVGSFAGTASKVIAALSHAVEADAELAAALRECLLDPNNSTFRMLLDRAVARGEVVAGNPALEHIPTLFTSAVISRPLLTGRTVDAEYLVDLVDSLMIPALTAPARTPLRQRGKNQQ